MRADVSLSPSPALWVILAVVEGNLGRLVLGQTLSLVERGVGEACGVLFPRRRHGERTSHPMVR
jgi:hypothetical protein